MISLQGMYRKDTEPLYHPFMYSLVSLLSVKWYYSKSMYFDQFLHIIAYLDVITQKYAKPIYQKFENTY